MNRQDIFEIDAPVKYIPESERAAMAADSFAGPNRTFPINSQEHVHSAAMLLHHAADPSKVKEKIIAIAKRKGYSLPQAWQSGADSETGGSSYMSVESEVLVKMGGEIKRIDDRKIGGYLALFTTPSDPDLSEDYFTHDTDFDIEDGERRSLYYNHGFDERIGNNKIGSFTTKKDDSGLWIEAQLAARDAYAYDVLKLVEQNALGYSSGAISHLVRRERVNKNAKSTWLKAWPLGEGSATTTPCEPRLLALPLKSWFNAAQGTPAAIVSGAAISINTLRELETYLHRDGGLSIQQAKTIASRFSLRDVESAPEATSDTFRGDALRELARTEYSRSLSLGVRV